MSPALGQIGSGELDTPEEPAAPNLDDLRSARKDPMKLSSEELTLFQRAANEIFGFEDPEGGQGRGAG